MSNSARVDILDLLRNNENTHPTISLKYFNLPNALFKYTSINKYTLQNLHDNNLFATVPSEFNDLYDSTMHFDTVSQYKRSINEVNKSSSDLGYEEVINQELKESFLKYAIELDTRKLTYLTDDYRIVCFSANNKDIKMWSHYGNNNKGICIAYDISKCSNELNKYVFPVIYVDKPIDVTELCEDNYKIGLAVLISIISKFNDWQYEKEWRIVFYFPDSKEKRIPLIKIPKPDHIFLGNRFIDNYRKAKKESQNEFIMIEEFLDYVNKSNINLKIIEPQIRSFKLEYKDIDVDKIRKQMQYL
jgi:hypothetical protein